MRVHPLDTEPSQVRQDIGGKTSGIRHTPQCPSIAHEPSLQGKYDWHTWFGFWLISMVLGLEDPSLTQPLVTGRVQGQDG